MNCFMNRPTRAKDLRKWSTWYNETRDLALEYDIRGVSVRVYRQLFKEYNSPTEAVKRLLLITGKADEVEW